MHDPDDQCGWPRCTADRALVWLGVPLCGRHWGKVCELTDEQPAAEVRRKLFSRRFGQWEPQKEQEPSAVPAPSGC